MDRAAGLRYSFALDPGSLAARYDLASDGAGAQITFAGSGGTVYGRIFDKDGGSSDYSQDVCVSNVPPSVTASADNSTIYLGDTLSGSGSFDDPGTSETYTATIDYGDSTTSDPFQVYKNTAFTFSHLYAAPGSYTVNVSVSDGSSSGSASFGVTVNAVTLVSMTVSKPDSYAAATAVDSSVPELDVPTDDEGNATVHISALTDPATAEAQALVRYEVLSEGGTVAAGALSGDGVDLMISSGAYDVYAWIDSNHNFICDSGEPVREMAVKAVDVRLTTSKPALTLTRPAQGDTAYSDVAVIRQTDGTNVTDPANLKGTLWVWINDPFRCVPVPESDAWVSINRNNDGHWEVSVSATSQLAAGKVYLVSVQNADDKDVRSLAIDLTVNPRP